MTFRALLTTRRGEHLVALQFVLFFGFILIPAWSPFASAALMETLAPWRWAALAIFGVVALVFAVLGVLALRPYLTPLPYPVEHSQLVRHGVYAWVRHPLYSSQIFAALGWTLYTLSLPHLAVLLLGFLFFDYKAAKEEAWLSERHPAYPDYARRVRKFVPWIY